MNRHVIRKYTKVSKYTSIFCGRIFSVVKFFRYRFICFRQSRDLSRQRSQFFLKTNLIEIKKKKKPKKF